jgi:tetratricopeptide (TPR) repeat protein
VQSLEKVEESVVRLEPLPRPMSRWVGIARLAVFFGALGVGLAVPGALPLAAAAVLAAAWIGWVFSRSVSALGPAIQTLAAGRIDEAAVELQRILSMRLLIPNIHATSLFSLALCHQARGALDQALECHLRMMRTPYPHDARHALFHMIAEIHVVKGNLDEARTFRDKARKLAPEIYVPNLDLLDVLIACRARDYASAVAKAEELERDQRVLPVTGLRELYLLHAFALVHQQSGYRSEDDSPSARRLLERLRPTIAGEFAYLTVAWEQMREFVEHRGWS